MYEIPGMWCFGNWFVDGICELMYAFPFHVWRLEKNENRLRKWNEGIGGATRGKKILLLCGLVVALHCKMHESSPSGKCINQLESSCLLEYTDSTFIFKLNPWRSFTYSPLRWGYVDHTKREVSIFFIFLLGRCHFSEIFVRREKKAVIFFRVSKNCFFLFVVR